MKRPDFFIVAAFKAGTTALYEYLRAHPQIRMSVPKEPMDFGADLAPGYPRLTEGEYLALFHDARPDSVYNPNPSTPSTRVRGATFGPPPALRSLFGRMRRMPLLHRVRDALVNANSRPAERARMDPALRAALTAEFAPQVAELSELIGRDLSAWSRA